MFWELAQDNTVLAFAISCAMAFICGWIADRIMGYAGFGVIGNWLLILIGCYVGLIAYGMAGFVIDEPQVLLAVAFGGGAMLLLLMASFKAMTHT
jgi:uncharacterized membrane protein YeaQ/YmgE (transglycosylase-associated protein family)